jgi:hypothetical protein
VGSWFVRPGTQVFLDTWGKSGTFDCFGDNSGVYVCLLDGFVTLSSRGRGLLLSSAGSGRFFFEEKSVPEKRLATDGGESIQLLYERGS